MLHDGSLFANRYRVRRRIGEGGMGAVYAVDDETAGEPVALKLLFDVDKSSVERFRRELRITRKITHANVARVHDIGEHEGRLYLTMELLEGESLRDMLDRCGALPIDWVHWIGRQVAGGLAAAHHAGIVHRDLKPQNVMICRDGRVVLIDFGIARLVDSAAFTDADKIVGTADYMAPEQVQRGDVGAHTDVYALGLVLFEALTGTQPFVGDSPVARAIARLREDPLDVSLTAPLTPFGLGQLVMRCMAREPAERPSMQELVSYFVDVVDNSSLGSRKPAPAPALSVPAPVVFGENDTERDDPLAKRSVSTIAPKQRILAVAPFEVRNDGSAAASTFAQVEEIGLGIAEELVDLLSMTRGLEVRRRMRGQSIEESGADTVVSGTVQLTASTVRIACRLVELKSGKQVWAEHFDGKRSDVLELQGRMARRIAESLRLQLETISYRDVVPAAAVDAYLKARRILRVPGYLSHQALTLIDEALALHPDFPLAIAARAMAVARAWHLPTWTSSVLDLEQEAPKAAKRALDVAGETPDAHLASAFVAMQHARFNDAVDAFRTCIEMAPTHAFAHEYLGRLQCEAGRVAQGITQIAHAAELDSSFAPSLAVVARCYAQRSRYAEADKVLAKARINTDAPEGQMVELRIANWTEDRPRAWALLGRIADVDEPIPRFMVLFARLVAREPVLHFVEQMQEQFQSMSTSPRWRALNLQIAFETFAKRDRAKALARLQRLGDLPFVDIEWLDHCPALESYRGERTFLDLHKKVRKRVDEMWGRVPG